MALGAGVGAVLAVPALRRRLLTRNLFPLVAAALPRISETERAALEAGTVWWDAALFSGNPDWSRLLSYPEKSLSAKERAFLSGPVEQVCSMVEDWKVNREGDLPPEVWRFLKEQKFFGMIIPEEYGGLGFSARAHSDVVLKLASRCGPLAVTVMVPNSLGPAELLLHYGTEEQKRWFLPRLASGEEIPCFALTGPEAGSDAAATTSTGVVCRGTYDGREVLGMRLNWEKRYTTLSPVATVIGLAFRLQDPSRLLGGDEDLGITVALVPADLPGIEIGERHDPLGQAFLNGPNRGRDVFVPLDAIVGGRAMAGQGWRMLMESLAAGRSISLPSSAVAGAQMATRATGAYASLREQFGMPIGRFEGIEERLARIGGLTYLMDSARRLTVAAVDAGEKPAVISAIAKAYLTEAARTVVNDAMDVFAGAGISRGPRNVIASMYQGAPIGITVEGANILTRSLIVYGQGAVRCHPWVQKEIRAAQSGDVDGLDRALVGHAGFVVANAGRAFARGLTGARFAPAPGNPLRGYFARFGRISSGFAIVSDMAMLSLGADLKRKEKLSGRLADVLAWMYLGSATLKRFTDDGCRREDLDFARWGCEHALHEAERALDGLLAELPNRPLAAALRVLVFPFGARSRGPGDALGARVARALLDGNPARVRIASDVYVPPAGEPGLGLLESALATVARARAVEQKVKAAARAGRLGGGGGDPADAALRAGVIDPRERQLLRDADEAKREATQVDAFRTGELYPRTGERPADTAAGPWATVHPD